MPRRPKQDPPTGNQDVEFLSAELDGAITAGRALVQRLKADDAGDAIANATLALRHLEDAQFRLDECAGELAAAAPKEEPTE